MATINAVANTIQNLNNMGSLNSATNLNTLFNGIANGDEIFFPSGTYVFPEDYSFDFEDKPIYFRGQSRERTIFTTFSTSETPQYSMRCPPRVDITKPRPEENGFYQIDTIGEVVNSAYTGLSNPQVGDYIELTGSTPDAEARTLEDVKNANYVTYVDANTTLPAYNGLYVVDKVPDLITGGYPYSAISAGGATLNVIIGSIIEYDDKLENSWNVYVPSIAFSSLSHIYIQNIGFIDFKPFIYNPYGINADRDLLIKDCDFKFCTRVSAFEVSGAPNGPGRLHAMDEGTNLEINSVPTQLYGFKSMQYINNSFSYIHQSIVWGMPSAHNILIKDNRCIENFSTLAYFVLIADAGTSDIVRRCFDYTIENNSMLSCRLDSIHPYDQTILFQFYDDAKFLSNTLIDCKGIHCYISGDNSTIEENNFQPYINPDLDVGISLCLYKNQNTPQPQHILSNNIIEGCTVAAIVTHQTGKILAIGNNIRMSRSENYVFPDTKLISKSLFYIVEDMETFEDLAGTDYIDPEVIAGGSPVKVYWEARQSWWTGGEILDRQNPAFDIGTSNPELVEVLYDTGFEIKNNVIHAERILKVGRRINLCEISGNTLTGLRDFILVGTYFTDEDPPVEHSYLENVIIKNNPLIELIRGGTFPANFTFEKNVLIENNTILHTYLSWLVVESRFGNITINNNYFDSVPYFPSLQPEIPISSLVEARSPFDVIIKGNTLFTKDVIKDSIRIASALNAYISENTAIIDSPESTNAERGFVRLMNDVSGLELLTITNNHVTFEDDGATERRILFSDDDNYIGNVLTISNNDAEGPGDIKLFGNPLTNIIFSVFRSINNSWIVNIQYDDDFDPAPTIPDKIVKIGYYEIYVILHTPSLVTDDVKVVVPSTFLQDGQMVVISASDAGLSDLTIDGGTIIGLSFPYDLTAGSSVTLKYRKSDDKWYLVN